MVTFFDSDIVAPNCVGCIKQVLFLFVVIHFVLASLRCLCARYDADDVSFRQILTRFGLLGYSRVVVAKSTAGIGTLNTQSAISVLIYSAFFYVYQFMVDRAGPLRRAVCAFGYGSSNPARSTTLIRLEPIGGGFSNPRENCHG